MKKILLTFVLVAVAASISFAQEQGEIRLSAGLALGTEAGFNDSGSTVGLGINIGGEYLITDMISGNLGYTYYFKSSYGGEGDYGFRLSSVDIDGKYYFLTDEMPVYGLFGVSILHSKSDYPSAYIDPVTGQWEVKTVTAKGSDTGLNFGGGILWPLNDGVNLNGQLKYQTSGPGQLVINAGIVYSLNY